MHPAINAAGHQARTAAMFEGYLKSWRARHSSDERRLRRS
jgi:hypothetical protein